MLQAKGRPKRQHLQAQEAGTGPSCGAAVGADSARSEATGNIVSPVTSPDMMAVSMGQVQSTRPTSSSSIHVLCDRVHLITSAHQASPLSSARGSFHRPMSPVVISCAAARSPEQGWCTSYAIHAGVTDALWERESRACSRCVVVDDALCGSRLQEPQAMQQVLPGSWLGEQALPALPALPAPQHANWAAPETQVCTRPPLQARSPMRVPRCRCAKAARRLAQTGSSQHLHSISGACKDATHALHRLVSEHGSSCPIAEIW